MPLDFVSLFLSHAMSVVSFWRVARDRHAIRLAKMEARQGYRKDMDTEAWREYEKLTFWERVGLAILLLQCCFQAIFMMKLIMAFQCEDSLWNLTTGCIKGGSSGNTVGAHARHMMGAQRGPSTQYC